jgi:hypothetical protein
MRRWHALLSIVSVFANLAAGYYLGREIERVDRVSWDDIRTVCGDAGPYAPNARPSMEREVVSPDDRRAGGTTLVSAQDPSGLVITGDQELIFSPDSNGTLFTLDGPGSLTVVRYYCPRHGDQSSSMTVAAVHGGDKRAHAYCWACYQEHLDAVLGEMRRVEPNE